MKFITSIVGLVLLSAISSAIIDFSEKGWGGDCIAGKRQSPIDFPSNYNYNKSDYFEILETSYNNINDLKFELENEKSYHIKGLQQSQGYLMVRKDGVKYRYNIFDIHFHILAEHTFGDVAQPTEMHMVHIKDRAWLAANNITETAEDKVNDYLVVGTIFSGSAASNNTEFARMNIGENKNIDNLNFRQYSNPDQAYYHYIGGLTTPDCNQVVNWVVNEKVVELSNSQINSVKTWIKGLYPNGNTRKVQPLNGRTLYYINKKPALDNNQSAGFLKGNLLFVVAAFIALLF